MRIKEEQVFISLTLPSPTQRDLHCIRGLEAELINFHGERHLKWIISILDGMTLVCRQEEIDKICNHPHLFGFSAPIFVREREIEM